MYKIDRRGGGLGGAQKVFSRKLPNCIIRIEYNLHFNFFKFDIMEFVFQKFLFSGVCLSGVCLSGVCLFRSLSFRSLSFRSLSFRSLSWRLGDHCIYAYIFWWPLYLPGSNIFIGEHCIYLADINIGDHCIYLARRKKFVFFNALKIDCRRGCLSSGHSRIRKYSHCRIIVYINTLRLI